MKPKVQLSKDEYGKCVNPTDYKSLVGGLRYLVHTCPDIAYAVGIVSRYMEKPTVMHLNAVKRILRYVRGTIDFGLIYSREQGSYLLSGFSDSDLAGNLDDRKSTAGLAPLSSNPTRLLDHLGLSKTTLCGTLILRGRVYGSYRCSLPGHLVEERSKENDI